MLLVQVGKQIQIKVVATVLMDFRYHMTIYFILKVKIVVLIKCSYRNPPPRAKIMLTIEPRMVIIF
jgi:hypothetical protein